MMTYLGKIGELTLKGSNIHTFEKLLLKNTKEYLKDTGAKVSLNAGRLYIDCEEKDSEQVEFTLRHLIGITGWAQTKTSEKTIEDIQKTVLETAKEAVQKGAKSFKIEAKRGDKKFPLNSYEIACQGASLVYDSGLMEVNVHNPDVIIYVEVRERCFIYSVAEKSCRGLPVGCSNKGLLLLSGGLDSPVAGYRMMRRGMKIECCYFHSYPYTSIEAQQKVEELARTLSAYGIQTYLNIIPFTDVQMKIKEKAPEEWSTLMLRVCMMKAANMLAFRVHADCIVTGESLGQVASQTLENMNITEHFAEYPLLRPLVGMDKEEIMADAHFIGTYDTSILPYEDCCVLFSPRHPILRGRIEDAEKIFASLEADELIKTAFENRQIKKFVCGKEVILKEEV
ncbi:MAG: tRNA uracil 4-sulfurtransferase ThiI [Treponema porcinum]|uniref:tRNA uracil 4-sulfurtransferase ThiI n=1 Tax=Treponema porcinum TaxID=261392 RepID=UPI0023557153|nr:tRNA uracil 4-sulfurtransferase ThiI [Treponema porcinum]MCI6321844.1 tRNA 4-thiouridine(8) synthase ThiI [Treponema porcinum]MCI6815219.1 tRNA 4-thiouridine(8) synthase ThiI [Treponema porcinum]MDY5049664.1 tRNA uracil 4-sulfurtransferase ThiI [Treponema porcinum]